MNRMRWRWEEQDFGFRFREGSGRSAIEHYQAAAPGAFYVVATSQRKLSKSRTDELANHRRAPAAPRIVPNPWTHYESHWDWIEGPDGILLNYAGCLDPDEIRRREDEGVVRAAEFIRGLLDRPRPAPLTLPLVRQAHRELLGHVYPFAGDWRTVALHKGEGPTKWWLPPGGIQPRMEALARDVLSRSPFLSDDARAVFGYASQLMGDLLAIHPFREGNGRTAFMLGNLVLLQNEFLPLDFYDRRRDEGRYLAACEAARIHTDYAPLARLLEEWENATLARERQPMTRHHRVDVKAILADPDQRRTLTVRVVQATQAREGIDTTEEQAERAYYVVTERGRVGCFSLQPQRGRGRTEADMRNETFVRCLRGEAPAVRFDVARRDFASIHGSVLAFQSLRWFAPIVQRFPPLVPQHGNARSGLNTTDMERFVRQRWETGADTSRRRWVTFAKGGEFCRFYSDLDLVFDWTASGAEFKRVVASKYGSASRFVKSEGDYFKKGITWMDMSTGINARALPDTGIFGVASPALFPSDPAQHGCLLGIFNSRAFDAFAHCLATLHWGATAIGSLPVPSLPEQLSRSIARHTEGIREAKATWDRGNEIAADFERPWILHDSWFNEGNPISRRLETLRAHEEAMEARIVRLYEALNDEVYTLYEIPASTRGIMESWLGERPPEVIWPQMQGRTAEQKRLEHVWRLLSYVVKRVMESDMDGVVPFAPLAGEPSLLERVHEELAALFPEQDVNQVEVEIANELKRKIKGYRSAGSIREWLESVYFEYHVRLYKKRPIFWHVASSQGVGSFAFGALCHYHKFDANRMAKLRSGYLRDAMETYRREAALAGREERAEDRMEMQARLEEAGTFDRKLQAVQEGRHDGPEGGDRDFRLLTPWKAPEERPTGWNPDIDDGVKVNITPLQKAGVLRVAKVV